MGWKRELAVSVLQVALLTLGLIMEFQPWVLAVFVFSLGFSLRGLSQELREALDEKQRQEAEV